MTATPTSERLNNLPAEIKEDLHYNLCVCHGIKKIDIVNAILEGATTCDEVAEKTGGWKGIGCCYLRIKDLINKIQSCNP